MSGLAGSYQAGLDHFRGKMCVESDSVVGMVWIQLRGMEEGLTVLGE